MCKAKLQDIAGVEFNSCLLNLYRDGSDHMGWHSDNEKLYGDNPTIGKSLLADLHWVEHLCAILKYISQVQAHHLLTLCVATSQQQ